MDWKKNLAIKLYEEGIIMFGEFTLTSGLKSPYYVDLRKIYSKPKLFKGVIEAYVRKVKTLPQVDVIAGIETGGIPLASVMAYLMDKPMVYVRKKPKKHGAKKQIEGEFSEGSYVVLVDDVSTTGSSLLKAVKALREQKGKVEYAIVFVDREQGAKEKLKETQVELTPIFKITEIMSILKNENLITQVLYDKIINYILQVKTNV